jgi:hypothetical protein
MWSTPGARRRDSRAVVAVGGGPACPRNLPLGLDSTESRHYACPVSLATLRSSSSSQSKRWVFRRPRLGEGIERPALWQGSDPAPCPFWASIQLNRGTSVLAVFAAATACAGARTETTQAPTLVFPAEFAEGEHRAAEGRMPEQAEQRSRSQDGGAVDPEASVAERRAAQLRRFGGLPDPPPLTTTSHYEYVVVHDRGKVYVGGVRPKTSPTPLPTARRIGRYAIELWIGKELIDRVRFDFPLLGAEPAPTGPRRPLDEPPSLAAGAIVAKAVIVPASRRATRAVLVDRATGEQQQLPWPPRLEAEGGDGVADAGK